MQRVVLQFESSFHVVAGNDRSQSAVMVLARNESTGGPDNRHPQSDQWLYVAAGEGEAVVAGQSHELRPGVLLLIEHGETHEIRNNGTDLLKTLNFYVPPAYTKQQGAPPERD